MSGFYASRPQVVPFMPGPERVSPVSLRPAVFLDRDDTLIANREVTAGSASPGDLFDPALVRLNPGVGPGLRLLREEGFVLVCVTNQGAVARGVCGLDAVIATNARLRACIRQEAGEGVDLDAVYFCPYHPHGTVAPWNTEHPWRKPAPGMFLQAADDLRLDLARSWAIGDAYRDIEAAIAAGIDPIRTLLVGDGPGPTTTIDRPIRRFAGFLEATEWVARAHAQA